MRFGTLTGLVSAVCADKFLDINKEIVNFSSKTWTDMHKITHRVGEGLCQPYVGFLFWDLKPLDAKRSIDMYYDSGFGDHAFGVKLCELEFPSSELAHYTADGTKYINNNK